MTERMGNRESMTAWARHLLSRTDVVILDTETCGLYENAHICEIAVIRPDGFELVNTRVRPAIPIPPEATQIHGITNQMVAAAPSIFLVAHELNSLLEGVETIVTYNADFDRDALDLSLSSGDSRLWSQFSAQWQWQCAMSAYAAWYGEWSYKRGRYAYQPLNGGHNALTDCFACLNRIREMAADAPSSSIPGGNPS